MAEILDQFGRPVRADIPARSKGRDLIASLGKDRDSLAASVATGITPERLAGILRSNDAGDNTDFVTLAMEMPERDLHYFSQLQIRRNATGGAQVKVRAQDEKNPAAVRIAEEFRTHVAERPTFRWLIEDLMDAINIGYSVVQPVWDTTTKPWTFKEFRHQDPRAFIWRERALRIRTPNDQDGRELPAGVYLVHMPRIRTGVPMRGGLARLAASTWFLKTFGVKSWVSFVEVFGMPFRLGRYNSDATEDEKIELLQTVISIGHDAAGIIPQGMTIDFPDARRPTSGDNLYEGLCNYFDEQTSKAVNGQTMSSDNGSSQSQALVHEHVRLDIAEHDCLTCAATLHQVAKLWTQFQYGANAPVPLVELDPRPAEGEKEKAETLESKGRALVQLRTAGYQMPLDEVQRFLGVRVTERELEAPEESKPDEDGGDEGEPRETAAANASIPDTELPDVADEVVAGAIGGDNWRDVIGPHRDAIETAAANATSYAEFEAALDGLADQIDSNPLVRSLAIASMRARGAGEA